MGRKPQSNSASRPRQPHKAKGTRPPGRPPKHAPAAFDEKALFDALVYGDPPARDDASQTVRYPGYRELADRFGVSLAAIGRFASARDVLARRRDAEQHRALRHQAEPLLESAMDADGELTWDEVKRTIRRYFRYINTAIEEGRLRPDLGELERLARFGEAIKARDANKDLLRPLGLPTLEQLMASIEERDRQYAQSSAAERGLLPIGRSDEEPGDGALHAHAPEQEVSQ